MANFVALNTKGGTGKTIFATQVLPAYFKTLDNNFNINIYEIDNNNKSNLANSSLNFKTLDLGKAEEGLQEADYNFADLNIIDVGGGDDTKAVLNYIEKNDILVDAYFIPTLNDFEQIHNIKQTIELIKKTDSTAPIYVVLNKVKNLDSETIKEQFLFIFGSEKYGISGALEEFEGDISGMLFLVDSNIYSILKNIYNKSLYDVLDIAEDYIGNIREYKQKWRAELDVEAYKKNMQFYSFLKDAKALADTNAKQLANVEAFNNIGC
jgi:hypothetical protein